jgi:hypothetical protein
MMLFAMGTMYSRAQAANQDATTFTGPTANANTTGPNIFQRELSTWPVSCRHPMRDS